MNIYEIERYLRGCLQRFYNTFGTNDAKLPERAIFMPHFPTQKREKMAERTVAEVTGSASAVVSSEDR